MIVVGAGVVGSSTAYNLVQHGAGKVLLLEQVESIILSVFCLSPHKIQRYPYPQPQNLLTSSWRGSTFRLGKSLSCKPILDLFM